MIVAWMQGAISMGFLVVAMFFVSFWRETRDRFFAFFATGFAVLSVHRTIFAFTYTNAAWTNFSFTLRLAGYLIILGAILDRRARPAASA